MSSTSTAASPTSTATCSARFPRALYFSYHTTAGYLEQALSTRLNGGKDGLQPYIEVFQTLFPAGADYRHDQMDLREELSEEQRIDEPRNADSHLAYIGSGLRNCVTYQNKPGAPVYFIDLDGVYERQAAKRLTSVVGLREERKIARTTLEIPVSRPPDRLDQPQGPEARPAAEHRRSGEQHGVEPRPHQRLARRHERQAGLTVNEYETLLMQHDLIEVLRDPLRFMAEKGRHMLSDPRAVPNRAIEYAKFDLVTVLNKLIDKLRHERVPGREGPRPHDGRPRRPLPAHEAFGEPADLRPADRAGLLPEPDPGAVEEERAPGAHARDRAHRIQLGPAFRQGHSLEGPPRSAVRPVGPP